MQELRISFLKQVFFCFKFAFKIDEIQFMIFSILDVVFILLCDVSAAMATSSGC